MNNRNQHFHGTCIVPKNVLRAFLAFTTHLFTPQNHKEVGTDTTLILHIRKLKQESVGFFFWLCSVFIAVEVFLYLW